ncbi:MAG: UnbV [Planctomycetaceae bacterium]|nr:UnbV [Planctomycetaceae bacterium]
MRRLPWEIFRSLWPLIVLAISLSAGCGVSKVKSPPEKTTAKNAAPPSESAFEFKEISAEWFNTAMVSAPVYHNGEETNHCSILESLGGGLGLADFDRDGWVDAIFPGGGEFTVDGKFRGWDTRCWRGQPDLRALEITLQSRVPAPRTYTHGVAIGDSDNDGFSDVLITGYQGVQFWVNQGDGTWTDSTIKSELQNDTAWSSSAAWGDIDGDGWLDLYVAHYVDWSFKNHPECVNPKHERDICPPRQFSPLPHRLWLGRGDGTFADGTAVCGLRADGKGLGVLIADLDLDNDLDIYVANDTTPNFLYHNEGHGQLHEIGMLSGTGLSDVGTPDGSMGISLGDFDNDGLPDLWVANYEREVFALYRNQGHCLFQHLSQAAGIAALGGAYVGFGTAFGDWDLNGDEDLVVSNGHVQHVPTNSPVHQLPLLLANRSGKRFENVSASAGEYFRVPHLGRGLASADIDHDGDADLVFTPTNEPAAILENRSPHTGHWIQLDLVAVKTSRDAIGARVTVVTDKGPRVRQVTSGGSYLSQSERVLIWGFPASSKLEKVVIAWPSGLEQTVVPPAWNTRSIVREGHPPLTLGSAMP